MRRPRAGTERTESSPVVAVSSKKPKKLVIGQRNRKPQSCGCTAAWPVWPCDWCKAMELHSQVFLSKPDLKVSWIRCSTAPHQLEKGRWIPHAPWKILKYVQPVEQNVPLDFTSQKRRTVTHAQDTDVWWLHSDSPPAKSGPLCNWKHETFGTKKQEGTWHCRLMVRAVSQSRGHLGSFLLLSNVGYSIHCSNLRAAAFFTAEEMRKHTSVNKHQRFKTCKTHIFAFLIYSLCHSV